VPLDLKTGPDFDLMVKNKVNAKLLVCSSEVITKGFDIPVIRFDELEKRLSSIVIEEGVSYPADSVNSDDLAEIVFTSGTTKIPKGVMIKHSNIASNLEAITPAMNKWKWAFNLMVNPKILSLVPLSHMYGQLIGIFVPLMIGSSVVFTNNLTPPAIVKAIKEEKIWILGVLPKFLEILKDYTIKNFGLDNEMFWKKYNRFKKYYWPIRICAFINLHFKLGWRFIAILVGGAVLDKSVDDFWRTTAYGIFQGYGLTETAPLVTLSDPIGSAAGSIGKALKGQQVKIEDGEILVRGPNVSPGYFGDEASTKESFTDGWFRTGDLAEVDKNGNIFFKGRKDDLIIRADGVNIFPRDIETVIKSNPAVKDCAVIGLKSGKHEEIHTVLLLDKNARDDPESIIREANKNLDAHQRIDNFSVWEEEDFPRTPTMKIKKNEIAMAVAGKEKMGGKKKMEMVEAESKSEGKDYGVLSGIMKSFPGIKLEDLSPGAKLEQDLGLDSLDTIRLAIEIEDKYNIPADDLPIGRDTTIKELEDYIKSPPGVSKKLPFHEFPYWKPAIFARTIFQYILYPFVSMLYRLRIYGRENLKNIKTPVVFASNHTSHLDSFVILYCLPLKIRKRVTAIMTVEHQFKDYFHRQGFVLKRIIEALGFYLLVNLAICVTPLSRTYGFNQTMENIGRLVSRDWTVLIYPEGGITPTGKMRRFEGGIGMIASEMKVPVIPVKIEGLYDILHHGILPLGHRPELPLVKVHFGKPLTFEEKDYKKVTEEIEKAVRAL
jgi:long-chain acyl-CoA synthetase